MSTTGYAPFKPSRSKPKTRLQMTIVGDDIAGLRRLLRFMLRSFGWRVVRIERAEGER